MSFLTINGLEVPIAASGQIRPVEIGSREMAFGGNTLIDRRAIKRRWRFLTTQLTEAEFKLIEAILLAKGQIWSFDDHVVGDTPAAVPYSTKGLASEGTFGGEYTVAAGIVGGHPVVDENGNDDALSVMSMHTMDAFTNDAGANVARGGDENGDTTNFAVLGAGSISYDTTRSWRGAGSIFVEPSGASLGVTLTPASFTLDEQTVFACYILPVANDTIRIRFKGDSSTRSFIDAAVTAGQWQRVVIQDALGPPNANPKIDVATLGGNDFYLDGVFHALVDSADVAIPPWVVDSYVDNSLELPISLVTGPELSLTCWVQMGWPDTNRALEYLFFIDTPTYSSDALILFRRLNSTDLRLTWRDNTGTSRTATSSALFASSAWHHVAVVLTGTSVVYYVNGAVVQSWTGLSDPPVIFETDPEAPVAFHIGNQSGSGNKWRGKIDELLVFPAQLSQEAITALQTTPWGGLPTVKAAGDFNPTPVDVKPSISTESYRTGHIAGTWTPNQRQLAFELQEV